MHRATPSFLPLFVGITLLLTGCDSQAKQEAFLDEANLPPAGFVQTDASGKVLKEDRDDWRTAPFFQGKIRVDPAFPNPTTGGTVTIPLFVLEFNTMQGRMVLRARDNTGRLLLLDEILDASDPGGYDFRFTPAVLGSTGLHRVFIFDALGELVSYGDLMIQ